MVIMCSFIVVEHEFRLPFTVSETGCAFEKRERDDGWSVGLRAKGVDHIGMVRAVARDTHSVTVRKVQPEVAETCFENFQHLSHNT